MMTKDCYIVFSETRNKYSDQIMGFAFFNCFETIEQAKAALEYEAKSHEGKAVWIDEECLELPQGGNPDVYTRIYLSSSVPFYDRDEKLFDYEKDNKEFLFVMPDDLSDKAAVLHAILAKAEADDWSFEMDEAVIEFYKSSPAGEDFGFSITFREEDSFDDLLHELYDVYFGFDTEEHVSELLEAKNNGFPGVPDIETLVEDANNINEMLSDLYDSVRDGVNAFKKASARKEPLSEKIEAAFERIKENVSSIDSGIHKIER